MPTQPDIERPPEDELDRPIKQRAMPPLPDLPDREWIAAVIKNVSYEYTTFNGKIEYVTNKDKEPVIDEETGQPIKRTQFTVEYVIVNHYLPNGDHRRGWAGMGSSLNEKAKLPKYLKKLGFPVDSDNPPTPKQIIKFLTGKDVFIQYETTELEDGTTKQKIVKDAIKLADKPHKVEKQQSTNEQFFGKKSRPGANAISREEEKAWDDDK